MGKYATKEQLTALVADMASKINIASGTQGVSGSYVPIGCIEAFMGVEAPPDFLVCDGSLQSIAAYPQLADHFYEQFGASNHFGGNGTTTFAVPDLRGEFLRGTGTNNHTNQGSGANVGEHQDGTIHSGASSASGQVRQADGVTSDDYRNNSDSYTATNILFTSSGAQSFASQGIVYTSRPTNTSVLWCIKAIDEKIQPGGGGIDYSTEEQDTGLKWIDGNNIYQKTLILDGSYTGSMNNIFDLGSGKTVLFIDGVGIDANNTIYPITFANATYPDENFGIFINSSGQGFFRGGSSTSLTRLVITLKYTKNS